MILFIKHIDIEGPGTIASYFKERGFKQEIIELAQGNELPTDLSEVEGIVILGGPMNVYEEDKHPWLAKENKFIQHALEKKTPLLGICLGSQLIAKASGAKVIKSPTKEIGWSKVDLTNEGEKDPLFNGVDPNLGVFQWHEDMVEIPENGILLASSPQCPNQAYRLGANAYGLQFHVEVTDDIIASWIQRYFKVEKADDHPEGKAMLIKYEGLKEYFNGEAEKIYQNFGKIIKERNVTSSARTN